MHLSFRKSVTDRLLTKIRSGEMMSRNEKFNLIIQLSIPSILAQVTTVLMFYIDAGMVGSLGAEPSAAIGLVEPATWLIFSLVSAVTMGFSVQVAHFIGANDFPKARAVMRHGYVFGLCFSLLMLLIAFLIGPRLPIWLGGGADIQHDAMVYFLIFSCITPFHLIEYMSGAMLKVAGDMRRPSMMAILMCVLDVIFNYFLIFPTRTISLFGIELTMPGLGAGVAGAALGSLLAFICVALPLAYYAIFRSPILAWKQDIERFSWRWQYIWNALKISAPMGLQYLFMNGAQLVSTMIVAPLGNVAIAAHSFAITAESLCYMPGYGISEAATTLVGQSVGADRRDLHRSFAWMTVFLGMIVMAFMGVVMYIFAPEMIGLLSPVTAIQDLGTSVLRIEAFAEPFFAAAIVAYSVCVGAGDTLKPSMINLGSMWLIRLTLAYCLASQYGLRGVWFAMAVELSLRGMMFIFYLFKRLQKT
ncbi:MATE family efflux transporter [Prevotella jejuni]|uniref:MATE family efflux transporter n=1 Tax=Prevotella jejuni TaxID=1177574 RepID=UPI001C5CCBDC|nr:MATE family efflux transporter [Prevotella jejuni]MBW4772529.1 MATE family efflux transporter [Prevotella jejuni]